MFSSKCLSLLLFKNKMLLGAAVRINSINPFFYVHFYWGLPGSIPIIIPIIIPNIISIMISIIISIVISIIIIPIIIIISIPIIIPIPGPGIDPRKTKIINGVKLNKILVDFCGLDAILDAEFNFGIEAPSFVIKIDFLVAFRFEGSIEIQI